MSVVVAYALLAVAFMLSAVMFLSQVQFNDFGLGFLYYRYILLRTLLPVVLALLAVLFYVFVPENRMLAFLLYVFCIVFGFFVVQYSSMPTVNPTSITSWVNSQDPWNENTLHYLFPTIYAKLLYIYHNTVSPPKERLYLRMLDNYFLANVAAILKSTTITEDLKKTLSRSLITPSDIKRRIIESAALTLVAPYVIVAGSLMVALTTVWYYESAQTWSKVATASIIVNYTMIVVNAKIKKDMTS